MKRFLLSFFISILVLFVNKANAQDYIETFTATPVGSLPTGFIAASNSDVSTYSRPGTCTITDRGILTPGVGPSAPTGFVLPVQTYNTSENNLVITFKIFVFDANLKCTSNKPFPCQTYVKAYLVPDTWNDPLGTPTATQYYAALPNYQIAYANTENTLIFNNLSLPQGTKYRVLLNLKSADNANCVTGNTKFIFDDFGVKKRSCVNCPPVANDDYFNSDAQGLFSPGTFFKGNVYGGYSLWSTQAPSGYEISSLSYSPAVNNGADYDLNNTSLGNVTFTLLNPSSPLTIANSPACLGTVSPGSIIFNSNGTFTYNRGSQCVKRVYFYYTLTNPFGTTSPIKVTIDLPGENITLPVTYTSFNAVRKSKVVELKWETASEENNRGFYIQRNTGGEWKDVAFVFSAAAANGNSNSNLSYAYKDPNASKGISQYRILQVDIDGKGRYSEIRSVRGEEQAAKVMVFPNPSTDKINVLFEDAETVREVTVTDIAGRVVRKYSNVTSGSIAIENLGDGFYNIQITDRHTGASTVEKAVMKKR